MNTPPNGQPLSDSLRKVSEDGIGPPDEPAHPITTGKRFAFEMMQYTYSGKGGIVYLDPKG